MRILLDECVPRRVRRMFPGHELVLTVPDAGFSGLSNGTLLRRAVGRFDVFVTIDKSIARQQNLRVHAIAFVLLSARTSDIADIAPLVVKLLERLHEIKIGTLLVIE